MLEHYFALERIVFVRIKGEDKRKKKNSIRFSVSRFVSNFAREKIYTLPVE